MKNVLKILAGLTLVLALLLGIGSLLLHIFLPPEKAKALVLKQLTDRLNREVQIDRVSIGVLSGLSVSNLRISESPDFSKGTFLSSELFSLRISLPPLLMKKIVVRQLILKHPEVTIVRNADGKTFNFSDLTTASTTSAPSTAPAPSAKGEPPFLLLVSRAELQKAVLHFIDRSPAQESLDINPLNLSIHNVSLVSPFSIRASMRVVRQKIETMLELSGDANLATQSFHLKSCSLSSRDSSITLTGKATELRSGHPNVDLKLDIKGFNPASLQPLLPMPAALKISGPLTGKGSIKGDQNDMGFTGFFDLTKPQIIYGNQFNKPAKLPFTVSMKGAVKDLHTLTLSGLQIVLGGLRLDGHGTVRTLASAPAPQLHLETNEFRIDEVSRLAPGAIPAALRVGGSAKLGVDVAGTSAVPEFALTLDGKNTSISKAGQFEKPAGVALQLAATGNRTTSGPSDQTITLKSLGGALGPLTFQGDGSYTMKGDVSALGLNIKTNVFAVQPLAALVPALAPYKPGGGLSLSIRASGNPSAPQLNGDAQLQNLSAVYERSALSQMTGVVHFTQQDVGIPQLAGKLNGSDFSLKLTGHQLTTRPDVNVEGNFAALDLDKILPPIAAPKTSMHYPWGALVAVAYAAAPPSAAMPPLKTSGHITVGKIKHQLYQAQNLDAVWNLSDVTPDLALVTGSAKFKQGGGRLQNIEKLAEVSKSIKLALTPILALQKLENKGFLKGVHLPSLQNLPFNSLVGDYSIRGGMMAVNAFDLTGNDLSLTTRGMMGLSGAQILSLQLTAKLALGAVGGTLGELIRDDAGRPTLKFSITGTASNPQVKLAMQEAGQKAVQKLGQELLKGLIKQPRPAEPAAPAASPTPDAGQPTPAAPAESPRDPVDDIQKALKSIFR